MKKSKKSKWIGLLSGALAVSGGVLLLSNLPENKRATAAENPISYALAFHEYILLEYDEHTSVFDPFGERVEVQAGKFTPLKEGEYLVKRGGVTNVIQVFLSVPVSTYDFAFTLKSGYSTNEMISLPTATVHSAITKEASYGVYVEKDGVLQKKLSAQDETCFQPTEEGEYSIIYTYVDYFGYISNERFTFTVTDAPVIAFDPPESLQYGENVTLGKVYAYCGEEKTEATASVLAPDGTEVDISTGNFRVDKAGEYTFSFEAEIGGQSVQASYTAVCDVYTGGQFTAVRMAEEPVENAEVPEGFFDAGEKGVLLQANVTGAVYEYKNVVDLNAITREQNILSFAPYFADGQGYVDDLTVKLTDVYDKYNSISIQFKRSPFHNDYTYVTAEYAGRHYAFDNENWVLTGVNGPVKIGDKYFFGGIMPKYWSMVGKHQFGNKFDMYSFTLDYAQREMILDLTSAGQSRYVLCDYDNPVWVGGEEYTWQGFTTGEAYLTIEFGTITGEGAAIVVTEVMGQKMNGSIVADTTPPSFLFDVENVRLENMPYGVVGKKYRLPTARALDAVCGETEVTRTLLKDGQPLTVDGEFLPTSAGEYVVRYEATDLKGNTAKKEFTFSVYTEESKPQIELTLGEYETPVTGSYFALPSLSVQGVSGDYEVQTVLTYNGTEVAADEAGRIYLNQVGELCYAVTVSDWLGQTVEKQFTIPVDTEEITFTVPNRYGVVQVGRTLVFADALVNDFVHGDEPITQTIFVNGAEVADKRYTVQSGDTELTVLYTVTCGEKSASQSFTLPVYGDISSLFVTDAEYIVGGENEDEVRFNFTQNGNVALVNAVSHNLLKISLAVTEMQVAKAENFYVDLRLQGATYASESVFVRVRKQDNTQVSLQLNGTGASYLLKGSFTTGTPFTFFYDCERRIFKEEVNENQIFRIANCENGDVFRGFTGGAAYFSCSVGGMTDGDRAQVRLVAISNETFSANFNVGRDIITPVVSVPFNGEVLTKTLHDRYVIAPTKAYDVVQGLFDVKVTVLAPDGSSVLSQVLDEAYTLSLSQYGRYTLYYETQEPLFTVKGSREIFIDVVDSVKPSITLDEELIKEATLGDVYTVVGGKVQDNVDSTVALRIVIYDSNYRNSYVQAGDTYRFVVRGTHKIVYFATDAAGNTQRIVHEIEVK